MLRNLIKNVLSRNGSRFLLNNSNDNFKLKSRLFSSKAVANSAQFIETNDDNVQKLMEEFMIVKENFLSKLMIIFLSLI